MSEPARAGAPAPGADPPRVLRPRAAAATLPVLGTVFLSGAVLLGVEMAASRVLAPFFGNSLFVWASIIGVILGGLALGYWLGGVLADRFPSPFALAAVVGAGALAVLSIPLIDTPSIEWVLDWDPGPRLDPVLCAVILFGPASVLLSAVGPVAVRLQVRALPSVGRTAGRTFAISTAGSIAGTFVTAFWLIPELGIEQLFVFAAAVLFATTALVGAAGRRLVARRRWARRRGGDERLCSLARHAAHRAAHGELVRNWSPLYRTHGYGYLDARDPGAVVEAKDLTVALRGGHPLPPARGRRRRRQPLPALRQLAPERDVPERAVPDAIPLHRPLPPRDRLQHRRAARAVHRARARASEKRLWRDFPQVQIQAVELDPVVVDVAYRYFHLPRDPRLRVDVGDGRRYLSASPRRYDVIVIDAFFADAIPAHLVTQEFLRLVRTRLTPGGVVVTNAIGAISGTGSRLFRSIYKTYRTAFPSVLVHPAILPAIGVTTSTGTSSSSPPTRPRRGASNSPTAGPRSARVSRRRPTSGSRSSTATTPRSRPRTSPC